jgi:hypothetical protein
MHNILVIKMTIQNIMKLLKTTCKSTLSIEELTKKEKTELDVAGIDVNGLFQDIEPELLRIAKQYADFYVKRYEDYYQEMMEKDPAKFAYDVQIGRVNRDGTLSEKRKEDQLRMGLTQKAFEIALQQIRVPYIPNDPTIDWRPCSPTKKKTSFDYDFYVPLFGRIDIKSSKYPRQSVVKINYRDFHKENPDFVVAYQILSGKEPKWLKLVGYLSNSEITGYKPRKTARPYYAIPIADFVRHDGFKLLDKLLATKGLINSLEGLNRRNITAAHPAEFSPFSQS